MLRPKEHDLAFMLEIHGDTLADDRLHLADAPFWTIDMTHQRTDLDKFR